MLRLAIVLSVVGVAASQQRLSDADVERATATFDYTANDWLPA